MKISDFFKVEYVDQASYDNLRKISSILDGQKNVTRKIVYTILEKNIKEKIKVSQLGSKVSEFSEYLHGNMDLSIVNLAQDFVGSNNIPLLQKNGNFGTRFLQDASASRYIYTYGSDIFFKLFEKKDTDVLIKQYFEGNKIEPLFYVPTLPIAVINGSEGVSSGFAQKILPRNPLDIIQHIKNILREKKTNFLLIPYYKKFKGVINQGENNKQWIIAGSFKKISLTKIEITEIPIGYDLKSYLSVLNNLEDNGIIKSYIDKSENDIFNFIVTLDTKTLSLSTEGEILDKLKLTKKITENYTFVDENNKIVVYENIEDVINHYIKIKLEYTQKRLEHQINELKYELKVNTSKAFFIMCVIKGDIILMNKKKDDVIEQIKKFDKIIEVDDNYNYILSLPLYNLTQEKFNELKDKVKSIKEEIKDLESKTPKEVWLSEIEELEKYLKKNGY